MIANQRQYRQAQTQLEEFKTTRQLTEARGPSDGVDPRLHAMLGTAFDSEVEVLREQIKRYEKLVAGQVRQIKVDALADIGLALIEARIAKGMTQKTLGQALGLAEQQIQRYEANEYTGASLGRLQEVADALDVGSSLRFDVRPAGARDGLADVGTAVGSAGTNTRASASSKTRRTTASRMVAKRTAASGRSQSKSARTSRSSSKSTRKGGGRSPGRKKLS